MNYIERWADIKGFDGLYQVSDMGNVRCTNYHNTHRTQNINPARSSNGYVSVMLYDKEGHRRYSVHRLVANAFIPNPENKPQVNHINGDKQDNRVNNLEWATTSENIVHSINSLHERTRPVMCLETGVSYISISEAGRSTGIDSSYIAKNAKGKNSSTRGLHWKYI